MDLSRIFEHTWQDVGVVHGDGQIRNQSVLGFTLCKVLEPILVGQHLIYDARVIPEGGFRPNLFIWSDEGKPTVVFLGTIKFQPEGPAAIQQGIKELCGYTSRSVVEVLADSSDTIDMNVSPNAEFGYFCLGDFKPEKVGRGIASNILSHDESARFHFAYASITGINSFTYQKPLSAGVDK